MGRTTTIGRAPNPYGRLTPGLCKGQYHQLVQAANQARADLDRALASARALFAEMRSVGLDGLADELEREQPLPPVA